MQKLHFLAAAAVLLGTTACPVDIDDPFDTLTTTLTAGDEVDTSTDAGTEDATTDATSTTDATTDATSTTDTGTEGSCSGFGCACVDSTTCDAGLECIDGTCQLAGSDTTTETTTDTGGEGSWDPAMCTAPAQVIEVPPLVGNFCSSPCANNDADCPAGPQGTQAACVLTTMQGADPSFCALICQVAMDACPAGATCKDLMDPMNPGLGLCTFP